MKIAVCAKQIPDPANPIEYSNGNVIRPEEQVLDDTDRIFKGICYKTRRTST